MGKDRQPDRRDARRFMTNLIDKVKNSVAQNCIAKVCSKKGCSLSLTGLTKQYVLIDMDKAPICPNTGKCDYLFVGYVDHLWVAPIELKGGGAKANEVVGQLRAGARFADNKVPKRAKVSFLPIVAFKKIRPIEARNLKKDFNKVSFRGQSVFVESMRCGEALISKLK